MSSLEPASTNLDTAWDADTRREVRAASAGTGKTTSLVLAYLRALQTTPARRIAAVTFTRLGAVDLRERIRDGIQRVLRDGAYLDFRVYHQQPFLEAEREISNASIDTIHGFFRMLLRLNAPTLGLDPEFRYLDEGEALERFRESVSVVLATAALHDGDALPAPAQVLLRHGWQDAARLLERLFARRVHAPFVAHDDHTRALVKTFDLALQGYEARLAGRALGPTDVELRTLGLLQHPACLARVRERVRVLFVDEFQDVNPLQAQVFRQLGLKHTVFVGDPKQSIYAFRDADVGAFLDVYQAAHKLAPLVTSYRHGAGLCRLYSAVAERLFPDFTELGLPPEVWPGRSKDASRAELHVFKNAAHNQNLPLEAVRQSEAAFLARRLQELNQHGRPWREIAVLVRSRGSLPLLERALAAQGVPFLSLAGARFYDRREIRDATNVLRAKFEPHDDSVLSALALLPGINMDAQTLERLRNTGNFVDALAASDHAAARRLQGLLDVVVQSKDAVRTLADAWAYLGPKAFTRQAQSHANLDGLLYQLAARGLRDPRAAVQFLNQARLKEMESDEPLELGDTVRLLTVHASKGLEFPVCAVFDLSRTQRNQGDDLVVHPDGRIALHETSLQGSPYHAIAKHLEQRQAGEADRLLYVAMTRAQDHLILTGSQTKQAQGWLGRILELQQHQTWPNLELATHTADSPQPPTPETQAQTSNTNAPFFPDPSLAKARFARVPRRVKAPTRTSASPHNDHGMPLWAFLPLGDAETIPDAERVIGVLTHYAIAENLDSARKTHRDVLAAQYVLHPYPEAAREAMLEQAWTLVQAYEHLYPNRSTRLRDEAELPFAFALGQTTWQGIIDRVYQEANGTWVLEDYKTDDVLPEELPGRAEAYRVQLAVYVRAVQEALGIVPEVRLTFLRHGAVLNFLPQELLPLLESETKPQQRTI